MTGTVLEQEQYPLCVYLVEPLGEKLISASPFLDHQGGLVIMEALELKEAKQIAQKDRAVLSSVFDYTVHLWKPLEDLFAEN
ncbi:YciI family protein [Bacillus sp. JCM 19041]|uniref:YciI family protein n=1 Tax=Bacillus sp. JCM 19041 TaxID=1460637 RepID=UPI000AD22D98